MPKRTFHGLGQNVPVIGAALRSIIIFVAVLSVPLSAAESLALTLAYRQPILLTGNLFVIFFVIRLADRLPFPEIIGAAVIAGAVVLLLGIFGLTDRLTNWIPVPIVYGLLAGVVLTFVADIFDQMTNEPILVGSIFITYLLLQRKVS